MTQATMSETNPGSAIDTPVEPLPKISGYALMREKGRGPKAVVYKARRIFENDLVAVKLFHPGACDRAMAAQLQTGVEKTEDLKHSGLIRALGFGTDEKRPFLVLEYASGESLANFMFRGQQFPPAKATAVVLYCARTLKFAADKGFCHGRLHPGRIILGRNNVRIAGVGMGERPEHAAWSGQFQHRFEPLIYTPPEALPSKPFPDKNASAVDIFSLGAILFQMLTCTPPYKGGDEGTLLAERARLKNPVEWPAGARIAYPKDLTNLIDAMLSHDPSKRPGYDEMITKLTAQQAALQSSGLEAWHGADAASSSGNAMKNLSAAETARAAIAKTVLDQPKSFTPTALSGAAASSSAAPIPTVPLLATKKPGESHRMPLTRSARHLAKRSVFDVVFSTLLFCMTAVVFCCAVYVTLQPYMPEKYRLVARWIPTPENAAARAVPTTSTNVKGSDGNSAAAKPAIDSANPEEGALALRQLDKIQEMLRNSDILPSAGLAKVLRSISDRAGRTTPTGIRALILAGEIESKISPGKAFELPPQMPVAPVAAPVAPVTTAPKVETPATAKPVAVAQPEPAKPPVAPAKPADAPKPIAGVTAAVKVARSQLKYFGYAKAKESLEQFAAKGNTEQKRIAADYRTLISYEEGLYERCHSKLIDHIKKDPRHESLLQVFPRENDPIGDDIIDFDEKGLSILVKGGNNKGVKITPWDKFPAKQVLNLLIPLSNKASIEDQIGMAVFAYNRGLTVEAEDALGKAEAMPNGKDKAGAVTDTFAKITRALEAPE